MSNLWFNIRFGTYHLQIGPNTLSFKQNKAQIELKQNNPKWKRFTIYCAFGKHY